jgi:hypothetical protein
MSTFSRASHGPAGRAWGDEVGKFDLPAREADGRGVPGWQPKLRDIQRSAIDPAKVVGSV